MDYTQTVDSAVHSGTNRRMHVDDVPVPTVFSAKDANSLIWGLANLCEKAGVTLAQFDADDPASYDKIYQAVNAMVTTAGDQLQNNINALANSVPISSGYDSQRRYKTGEICYVDGIYYECYHPSGTLNKDPRTPANRPDGWTNTDQSAPYYWLKLGKVLVPSAPGKLETWETTTLPQNRIKALPTALNATKFWRLASAMPNLVSNGQIVFPADVRGQTPKFLDETGAVDETGRTLLSLQGDAQRKIQGSLIAMYGSAAGAFREEERWGGFEEGQNNFKRFSFDSSRVVPTAPRNRVENYAVLAVRCI